VDVEAQRYKSMSLLCRDQSVRGVGRNSLTPIQNGKERILQPPLEDQQKYSTSLKPDRQLHLSRSGMITDA
jgi:hypothetical protein